MAEFLIYDKEHWMDKMTAERYAELIKRPHFAEKYLSRYQRGDIVEVRPDGFWTGANARGFNEDAFRVVSVPGLPPDKKYMESTGAERRRRFAVSVNDSKVTIRPKMNDVGLQDRGSQIG